MGQGYPDLYEAIQRLQYKEFFKEKGVKLYSAEFTVLQSLKKSTITEDSTKCKVIIDNSAYSCKKMFLDFKEFKKRRREESENFKFWDQFVNRHEIILIWLELIERETGSSILMQCSDLYMNLPHGTQPIIHGGGQFTWKRHETCIKLTQTFTKIS